MTYLSELSQLDRAVTKAGMALAKAHAHREDRIRARIVAAARYWGLRHEKLIHYAEVRPIPIQPNGKVPPLPLTTDCSGFFTLCYRAAGCPDPNGNNYNGEGFTGTLLKHGSIIPWRLAKPGDGVVYGEGNGHHVGILVKKAATVFSCMTVSHGFEGGPIEISIRNEMKYQPPGLRFVSFPLV